MNDTLRLVNRLGGKVTSVSVSGGDALPVAPAARQSKKRGIN